MLTGSPVTTVCLPPATPVDRLVTEAAGHLPPGTTSTPVPVPYFRTRRRLCTGKLLLASRRSTAGGPLGLLDFDAMAADARAAAHHRHTVWQRVVAHTRVAQPYWVFLQRHQANPAKYTFDQAHQSYLAQPRVAAMRTYNLLPTRVMDLPTSHLEALQAGVDTYTHLGGLAAVPGIALITLTGRHLRPASGRLADWLTFLEQAHAHLRSLTSTHQLVALGDA